MGSLGARSAAHDPFQSTAEISHGRASESRDRFRSKGPGSGAAFVRPRRAGIKENYSNRFTPLVETTAALMPSNRILRLS
jgi:hypothetical protein